MGFKYKIGGEGEIIGSRERTKLWGKLLEWKKKLFSIKQNRWFI